MKCPFRSTQVSRTKYAYRDDGKVDKILVQRSEEMLDCLGDDCPFHNESYDYNCKRICDALDE